MIRYTKKFSFLKVDEVWFGYKFKFSDLFTLNTHLHVKDQDNKKIYGVRSDTCTVELNIEKDIETIFSNFRTSVKQEIRKSEKEGVTCAFRNNAIDEFIDFYNDFASAKNIYTTKRERIVEMGDNFKISFASLNGQVIVAHSYLMDKKTGIARLFHSASKRLDETIDRNIIGRANKLLTYFDIQYFKEQGMKILDFGGYSEDTEDKSLKGINEFKLSFGGEKVTCVNYNSLPYHLLKKIWKKS